jgi:hypothetical protein
MSQDGRAIGNYNGLWLATVVNNNDPDNRNRAQVRIPGLYGDDVSLSDLPWAELCTATFGVGHGQIHSPSIGCSVWVMFRQGHAEFPIIVGGSLINSDSVNGSSIRVTAGDRSHLVQGLDTVVSQNRIRETRGDENIIVQGTSTSIHGNSRMTVEGTHTVDIGIVSATIRGRCDTTVTGDLTMSSLSRITQNCLSDRTDVIGGSSDARIVERCAIVSGQAMILGSTQGSVDIKSGVVAVSKLTLTPTGDAQLSAPVSIKFGNGGHALVLGDRLMDKLNSILDIFINSNPLVITSTGVASPSVIANAIQMKAQLAQILSTKVSTE